MAKSPVSCACPLPPDWAETSVIATLLSGHARRPFPRQQLKHCRHETAGRQRYLGTNPRHQPHSATRQKSDSHGLLGGLKPGFGVPQLAAALLQASLLAGFGLVAESARASSRPRKAAASRRTPSRRLRRHSGKLVSVRASPPDVIRPAEFASFPQNERLLAPFLGSFWPFLASFWVRFPTLFLCFQALLSFVPTILHFSYFPSPQLPSPSSLSPGRGKRGKG